MTGPEFDTEDDLERRLAQVAPVNPPRDMTAAIMARVTETEQGFSTWRRWRRAAHAARITNFLRRGRVDRAQGGSIVAKKAILAFAGVGAAAILVFIITGYPPTGSGSEGAIGAARRDQTAQVAAADVKVTDPAVQQFIQSDAFDKVMKDPQARSFMSQVASNSALSQAVSSVAQSHLMSNAQVASLFSNQAYAQVMSSASFAQLMSNSATASQLASLSAAASQAAASNAAAASNSATQTFAQLASSQQFSQLASSQHFAQLASTAAFVQLMSNSGFAQAMSNPPFAQAMSNTQFLSLIHISEPTRPY